MKIKTPILIVTGVVLLSGLFLIFRPKTEQMSPPSVIQEASQNKPQTIVSIQTVAMKAGVFEPKTLTVQKGTNIVFKNEDTQDRWPASAIHPTHGIYPEFDPRQSIKPGGEWSFVFDKVGNWKYHDHLSPAIFGEIKVVETKEELDKR